MATMLLRRLGATAAEALRTYNIELLAKQAAQQLAPISTTPVLERKKKKCLTPLDKCKKKVKKCRKSLSRMKLAVKCAKLAAKKHKKRKSRKSRKSKKSKKSKKSRRSRKK